MEELQLAYENFINDLLIEAESSGVLQADAFFQLYASAAIENGDVEHVEHCPIRTEGTRKFGLDGYSFNSEQGELILAICDFRSVDELTSLNASDIEALFKQVDRLFENSLDSAFINHLEDSSSTFEVAYTIHANISDIRRVRIVLFSNARTAVRKKLVTMREHNGIRYSYSILDFERYIAILNSKNSSDPIEIDFTENGLSPLPCLQASSSTDEYASFLVVVPGKILAEVYGLYGARLLEANVRTFLQARTKVNKGIIRTIKDDPTNFFAFNNGLTATASAIELSNEGDLTTIKSISNLQVVNGGQTTASILYARDKDKADLSDVYVQMKLSVVEEEFMEDIVPKISRFANTQNRISEADFFSSHPYHLHIERLSRRITAPPKEGAIAGTLWFYERARGQYKDQQAYMTQANRNKFLAKNPRDQMIVKTDHAKYEMSFKREPHWVSRGAQKCFLEYAKYINEKWNPEALEFGDSYFKEIMMRALIFRWTDKMIGTSEWYKEDRGYKAQIVTYTIAVFSSGLHKSKMNLDYMKIWSRQEVPGVIRTFLEQLAPRVADLLKAPPPSVRNIAEYCKTQMCWTKIDEELTTDVKSSLRGTLISLEETRKRNKDNKDERKIDSGIDAQTKVFELADKWAEIKQYAIIESLITPVESSILDIAARIPNKLPTEKQCKICVKVLQRVLEEGYSLD